MKVLSSSLNHGILLLSSHHQQDVHNNSKKRGGGLANTRISFRFGNLEIAATPSSYFKHRYVIYFKPAARLFLLVFEIRSYQS